MALSCLEIIARIKDEEEMLKAGAGGLHSLYPARQMPLDSLRLVSLQSLKMEQFIQQKNSPLFGSDFPNGQRVVCVDHLFKYSASPAPSGCRKGIRRNHRGHP